MESSPVLSQPWCESKHDSFSMMSLTIEHLRMAGVGKIRAFVGALLMSRQEHEILQHSQYVAAVSEHLVRRYGESPPPQMLDVIAATDLAGDFRNDP